MKPWKLKRLGKNANYVVCNFKVHLVDPMLTWFQQRSVNHRWFTAAYKHLNYHRVFSLRAHSFVWFSPSDGLFPGHSCLLRHRQPRVLTVIETSDVALNLQVCAHENRTLLGKKSFSIVNFSIGVISCSRWHLLAFP